MDAADLASRLAILEAILARRETHLARVQRCLAHEHARVRKLCDAIEALRPRLDGPTLAALDAALSD